MAKPDETLDEITERKTMETVRDFLNDSGLATSVEWTRPDSNDFPDYWAEVGGQRWAFEITRLWELPREAYVRKPPARTLGEIQNSSKMYPVPTDSNTLHERLEKAFADKSQQKRLELLCGALYCLVIVNGQFDDRDAWIEMANRFELSQFHTVIIAHFPVSDPKNDLIFPRDLRPVCEVWKNGFGTELPEHTISELFPG